MTSFLQFTKVEKYANLVKMGLTQSHLRTSFQIFSSLSFSFNRAETSRIAHPVRFMTI
jgi:hypothetical protein